jgi:hypothetical protein
MKIGKTNAIAISGGVTKTPYEEWQEGFGANWDSIIQNAPQAGVYPVLHIYSKVNSIRHNSSFNYAVTYNPTTGIYRPVTTDANKNLFFEESDYFINDYDGLSYVCVIYKAGSYWGDWSFRTTLPVVYSNTKFCSGGANADKYISLINESSSLYPFLRGVDCYNPDTLYISAWLEHLTLQEYQSSIRIERINGSDTQVRILKHIVDSAPSVTLGSVQFSSVIISDENLADWFYNDFFYNRFVYNTFIYGLQSTNIVRQFNIRPDIQFYGNSYLNSMPNMIYLNGFISEDVTNTTYAGCHGFNNGGWVMLQNFPMWKVLQGATTGCLLPMTNENNYTSGSFMFYSKNLESRYFCEFDENGIIEDPTKYFICNLPIEINTHTNIYVRFMDLTFKNNYTAAQQDLIRAYLAHKKWNLVW